MKEDLSSKEVCCNDVNNLSPKKKQKLESLAIRYKSHETFIIAREARKTIRFIEKNTENFPNKYYVLKNKIISSFYNILNKVESVININ
ncbi:MAG: hypothetical protein IKD77_01130 [Bacilli bacterium]|nr:hypothetical protein [Bacilli bacterium]